MSIPYDKIIDLEYGQKAGRRVGAAIGYSPLLACSDCSRCSPKRETNLTIGFKDGSDKDQVTVIELGKGHRSFNHPNCRKPFGQE
jgi:hypothetical protein